jgi:hypothetical protein
LFRKEVNGGEVKREGGDGGEENNFIIFMILT